MGQSLNNLINSDTPTGVRNIPYPSKYDIIPIHASDRGTFKYCRRQWAWSSPSRANLVPKAHVYGIYEPFWFGEGIHLALEKFYDPDLKEDPAVVWMTWFDLQVYGGEVVKEELRGLMDRDPQPTNHGTFKVDGLSDLLPFFDAEHFEQVRDLGRGMMDFYKDYAEENDDFEVLAVEHDFSVPLQEPRTDRPMYMEDTRRMPENWEPDYDTENYFGPLMFVQNGTIYKQVHARGRMDKVIREYNTNRHGILDHKTTSKLDNDYFRHLELDEQCTAYMWAGQREAEMYDLEYKKLDYIIYEGIMKGYPRVPTILSNGMPSLSRTKETTTARKFAETIRVLNLQVVFEQDAKMQSYYQWLLEQGDKRYIDRKETWRNKIQLRNMGLRLYYEAEDMLNNPRLYPSPKKEYGCLNCRFRAPCVAAETGGDYKSIIEDGYVENWDR
jgi:hypothetical protein